MNFMIQSLLYPGIPDIEEKYPFLLNYKLSYESEMETITDWKTGETTETGTILYTSFIEIDSLEEFVELQKKFDVELIIFTEHNESYPTIFIHDNYFE